jgi:protein-disulfide isomerase-like protein with CxxC motif
MGMTEAEERAYIEGQRALLRRQLAEILRALGVDSPEWTTRWVIEREEAIAALRDLCRRHGDNDWPDEMALCDIIDKHLGKHLG